MKRHCVKVATAGGTAATASLDVNVIASGRGQSGKDASVFDSTGGMLK